MLKLLFNRHRLADEKLRAWCIQQVVASGVQLSVQQLCIEAEELFNYIKEGVPYQAGWVKRGKP